MATKVWRMPIVSASTPPASGPTAAERIWADWIRPTARPVCSRGQPEVAMARPSGPMPPKSPTPTRSASSCHTSRAAAVSSSSAT